ncbi:hypothetical protein HGRIS_003095 [Hohenbuehelia grisea]|uniref:Uncharacterized protein n=1 Tax=Hohenbuehelia grisea TaxID=104357 RepID=A0ABR3JPB2_9AGAR
MPRPTPNIVSLQKTKADCIAEFGRSERTAKAYTGYIKAGRLFLDNLSKELRKDREGAQGINIDELEKAFDNPPNQYSALALEFFITQKCFTENCSVSTGDGIHGAFADLWDNM